MPKPLLHIAQVYIETTNGDIDGVYKLLDVKKYMGNLMSVEVDDSLYLPDMFAIHFLDPDVSILEEDFFKPGIKVKISIIQQADPDQKPILLMKGEITAVEPDLNNTQRST